MIYAIHQKTEYGKHGTTGINVMAELTSDAGIVYAHSKEQALGWIKKGATFANSEDWAGGRYAFWSEWREKDHINILYDNGSDVQRSTVVMYPVNTVFESTGYN